MPTSLRIKYLLGIAGIFNIKNNVRFNRNKLLADSDWTQLPDSPLSTSVKTEWATYRQTLRDLTDNIDSNGEVTYPTAPSS